MNKEIFDKHKQLYPDSCIPMSLELILKAQGIVAPDKFPYQNVSEYRNHDDWYHKAGEGKITFTNNPGLSKKEILKKINDELVLRKNTSCCPEASRAGIPSHVRRD
jgi:hypothetical protein